MRILYITTELPYPLSSGFLRHYHFLRHLGQRHAITYLSLTRKDAVSAETYAALAPYAAPIAVFGDRGSTEPWYVRWVGRLPLAGSRIARALRLRLAARQLTAAVHQVLSHHAIDLIVHSGKDTFPAIAHVDDVPVVIDCCDATSLRVAGEMPFAHWARRLWLQLRLWEVRRIERRIVRKTRHLAFASRRDQQAMLGHTHQGEIIPQAVDLGHWTRRQHQPRPNTIVFTGVMSYPPNHDAALFLIRQILPRVRQHVPEAELLVVGRNPLPELVAAVAGRNWVTLTGEPRDMRDYFELATVCCAPVRFASGMQFKVLEAMAMEVPVVTTPPAADGLQIDGAVPPLVVGRSAMELAAGIVDLLRRPQERARLAAAGRQYVEEHFVWEHSVAKLEQLCRAASGDRCAARVPDAPAPVAPRSAPQLTGHP